jgi:uncharacterized glyoxalase superfamily protein PhnB
MKFAAVTPNLVVSDIGRSLEFYRDVLGFAVFATVPEQAPFAFAWMRRDAVNVYLNSTEAVRAEHAHLADRVGGAATMYMMVEAESTAAGIDALYADLKDRATVMMPLKDQFYGIREFGIEDPDGYVIFIAQQLPKTVRKP